MPQTISQGYAVDLYFDDQTEAKILSFRNSIYEKGISPVLGKMGDKPHVSLAVFSRADPDQLVMISEVFSKTVQSFPVQLDAVGVFPTGDNVLFLTPIPSLFLLEIHRQFHEILSQNDIQCSEHYFPGRWIPHCTLEFNLPDDQLDLALHWCRRTFTPIRGRFDKWGVVSYHPIQYLAEYPLRLQGEN
ncbi:MAG: 2'-5' RNA ligase family protein [Chloroflexi bacterium]|nr:2'-5' RNA ligase family protein [Chloroflexota bacterium]